MPIVPPADYPSVLPLVRASGLHGHLTFAYAVLEGRQEGLVMLSGAGDSAIVCNYSGFMLAFGRPDEALAREFLSTPRENPFDIKNGEIYGASAAWAALLADMLPAGGRVARLGYAYRPNSSHLSHHWQDRLPPGLRLVPIDAALARSIADGTGTFDYGIGPWFIEIAGGPEGYAALGLGLALVDDQGQVASLCGICALGGGEAEMEVGTTPPYRGKGLATLVCAAFIDQAREQGWHPAYTTASDNIPSIHVAHKLGFVEVEEIKGVTV